MQAIIIIILTVTSSAFARPDFILQIASPHSYAPVRYNTNTLLQGYVAGAETSVGLYFTRILNLAVTVFVGYEKARYRFPADQFTENPTIRFDSIRYGIETIKYLPFHLHAGFGIQADYLFRGEFRVADRIIPFSADMEGHDFFGDLFAGITIPAGNFKTFSLTVPIDIHFRRSILIDYSNNMEIGLKSGLRLQLR
ncbi:MAG: hypothetical protein A2096_04950 [Spirochaetes bacterium GWF1_41_5]|nr:MAG: hypothetical protein A2096_04950 [Spirochaetes bacterium GWF1_41_5]